MDTGVGVMSWKLIFYFILFLKLDCRRVEFLFKKVLLVWQMNDNFEKHGSFKISRSHRKI